MVHPEDIVAADEWILSHNLRGGYWAALIETWRVITASVRIVKRCPDDGWPFESKEKLLATCAISTAAIGTPLFIAQKAWGPEFGVNLHINDDGAEVEVFAESGSIWSSKFEPRAGLALLKCLYAYDAHEASDAI